MVRPRWRRAVKKKKKEKHRFRCQKTIQRRAAGRPSGLCAESRGNSLRSNPLAGFTFPLGFPARPSPPRCTTRGSAYMKVNQLQHRNIIITIIACTILYL